MRFRRDFDGGSGTNTLIGDVCRHVLDKLIVQQKQHPEEVLAAWPSLVGEPFSAYSRAEAFTDGLLRVVVHNSAVLAQLAQAYRRAQLLNAVRQRFPSILIRDLLLRIGY